jgi:hypothetical protein
MIRLTKLVKFQPVRATSDNLRSPGPTSVLCRDDMIKVLLTLILTPAFMVLLMRGSRQPPRIDGSGRFVIGLTVGLAVLGSLSAMFFLGFLVAYLTLLLDPSPRKADDTLLMVLAPLLCVLFGFVIYAVFGVGARFGPDGVLYRNLRGTRLVPWSDICEVIDNPLAGTYLRTRAGTLWISKYRRGFPQFLEELRRRRIRGADDEFLERP